MCATLPFNFNPSPSPSPVHTRRAFPLPHSNTFTPIRVHISAYLVQGVNTVLEPLGLIFQLLQTHVDNKDQHLYFSEKDRACVYVRMCVSM